MADSDGDGGGPPFFKGWSGAYLLVLGTLAGVIIVLAIVTRIYP